MRKPWWVGAGFAGALGCFLACGSSSDGGSPAKACVPGQSIACAGAGGCSGAQICAADGSSYGPCDCGGGIGGDDGGARDASTGADGNVDIAQIVSPREIAGLRVWVDGSHVGDAGTSVTDWPDLSNGGNDLIAVNTPPTRAPAAVGGLDALAFSGGWVSQTFGGLGGTFLIEMVVKPNACTSACGILSFGTSNPAVSVSLQSGTLKATESNGSTSFEQTLPLGSGAHVIGLYATSAVAELRVDGLSSTSVLTGPYSFDTAQFNAGANKADSTLLDGDIAEVVFVANPSDADRDAQRLEGYLKSKYGL